MIELKYSIFFASFSTQQEVASPVLTALRAILRTSITGKKHSPASHQPEKYRSPPVARTALNQGISNCVRIYLPHTELSWKDALFLSILTLLMDGVPGRSQKAAVFLGLLLGFETFLSCFQITRIFFLTLRAGMYCFSWVFGK